MAPLVIGFHFGSFIICIKNAGLGYGQTMEYVHGEVEVITIHEIDITKGGYK